MEKNETATAPDWKEIAYRLAEQVGFALQHLDVRSGTGLLINMETGKVEPWRNFMIRSLESIPGLKVDREMADAYALPAKERRKRVATIEKRRAAEQAEAAGEQP